MTTIRTLAALAVVVASLPAFAQERWTTYANERFGTVVDYPDLFDTLDPPPANGDGQSFRTRDRRARLAAYGFYNVESDTMRQLMLKQKQEGTAYPYASANQDSFALSGIKAGRVVYTRCIVSAQSSDIVNCVELDYPETEIRRWDEIVGRVSRSLRSQAPS